ncbi:hypothetical protein Pcinc_009853 [Petrolisthes cinctipes]|uniref:Uncharacterized protein n=1 Tax=Petrolisthes cinctipes TaxID=88211 RepID=A0AAE1KV24_PETCI|nr:hypothetical protein Pcinc_009853 [Petrolisthes cinctipes]
MASAGVGLQAVPAFLIFHGCEEKGMSNERSELGYSACSAYSAIQPALLINELGYLANRKKYLNSERGELGYSVRSAYSASSAT